MGRSRNSHAFFVSIHLNELLTGRIRGIGGAKSENDETILVDHLIFTLFHAIDSNFAIGTNGK